MKMITKKENQNMKNLYKSDNMKIDISQTI